MPASEPVIALIGGTGDEGRGIALRLAAAGASVVIGSRSCDRAQAVAAELNSKLGGEAVRYSDNDGAASVAGLAILTVPFGHAASTIDSISGKLHRGAILVDATVPLSFDKGKVSYENQPEGSGSAHLRARLRPEIEIVAAFKTIPAHLMLDLNHPLDCDEFVAGDSAEAKAQVIQTLGRIPNLRPVDAGSLEAAAALEQMTALAIRINRRYKVKTARFKVVGL